MRCRFALPFFARAQTRALGPLVWITLSSLSLLACAKEHSARELIERAGANGPRQVEWQEEGEDEVAPPTMGPIGAGPHRPRDGGVDAGRIGFPFDARIPLPEAGLPFPFPYDASLPRPDAGRGDPRLDAGPSDAGVDARLPAWQTPDSATVDATVVAECDPPSTPAPLPDAGCRVGWHTPPCYRAPSDCPALRESAHCTGFNGDGDLLLFGLEHGTSCRIAHDTRYPSGAGSNAFAQIGADIYAIDGDVILKRSLTDGSFDVAAVQAWTIFAMGDSLIVQALDGSIRRFASWEQLKSGAVGEEIATSSPGSNPAFGANRTTMAAAWPDGSLYLLTPGDLRQRTLRLENYNRAEFGAIRGLDLDDGGRLFLSTDLGLSIYSTQSGRLLSRMRTPTLFGLSCEAGLPAGTTPPVLSASPRPGYYAPDASGYVLSSSDCRGPFNGPRYVGQKGGPELFVIGNFFTDPSVVRDERSTPHVLVLTTIESTQWTVIVAPGANVERILVNGSTSSVSVQSASPVPIETFFDARSLGSHPGEWPSLDESNFRAAVETQTNRAVTESFGCHFGSTYLVSNAPPLCAAP